jgi:hypothetical protein
MLPLVPEPITANIRRPNQFAGVRARKEKVSGAHMMIFRRDMIVGCRFCLVRLEYPRRDRTHFHDAVLACSVPSFDIFPTSDTGDDITEFYNRPALGVGGGVAEGVEEEGGDDGAGFGAGGVGAAPDLRRPVQ